MTRNFAIVILSGLVVMQYFRVPDPPVVKFYTPPPFGVQLRMGTMTAAAASVTQCTLGIIQN